MTLDLSEGNCVYRGEGNFGLVICFKKEEKVLKLIKSSSNEVPLKLHDQGRKFENQVNIIKKVMKPLLGEELVNVPALILMSKERIEKLNKFLNPSRPSFRKIKNISEEDSYALLFPDYCTLPPELKLLPSYGPVISIEIKPKQGFVSDELNMPSCINSRIPVMCRYCMMQQYKIKRNLLNVKSDYCPTDLFSGCPTRMHHALKMLLLTPQNNIRIFKDQTLLYSEENKCDLEEELSDFLSETDRSCSDLLCELIIKVLLQPYHFAEDKNAINIIEESVLKRCENAYPNCTEEDPCHKLPPGSVLFRILNVQMLSKTNMQALYSFYNDIQRSDEEDDLGEIGVFSRSDIPPYLGENEKMDKEMELQFSSRKLWEFLVALTLRDCSIMLVFKKYGVSGSTQERTNLVTDQDGNHYLYGVAILDLDPKPLKKVKMLYEETPHLLQSCLSQAV